jgi:mono/diheme cytochrome c family protein
MNTTCISRRRLATALLLAALSIVTSAALAATAASDRDAVKRGEYLANYGGCNDCHTPKLMTDKGPVPDRKRLLSGFPAGAPVPPVPGQALAPDKWMAATNAELTAWVGPWGISFAANLTPHKTTGMGAWTAEQFVQSMRTGKHLGVGRPILPPMPWFSVAALNDRDIRALFAYLQSIPPIENAVPQPLPPARP